MKNSTDFNILSISANDVLDKLMVLYKRQLNKRVTAYIGRIVNHENGVVESGASNLCCMLHDVDGGRFIVLKLSTLRTLFDFIVKKNWLKSRRLTFLEKTFMKHEWFKDRRSDINKELAKRKKAEQLLKAKKKIIEAEQEVLELESNAKCSHPKCCIKNIHHKTLGFWYDSKICLKCGEQWNQREDDITATQGNVLDRSFIETQQHAHGYRKLK